MVVAARTARLAVPYSYCPGTGSVRRPMLASNREMERGKREERNTTMAHALIALIALDGAHVGDRLLHALDTLTWTAGMLGGPVLFFLGLLAVGAGLAALVPLVGGLFFTRLRKTALITLGISAALFGLGVLLIATGPAPDDCGCFPQFTPRRLGAS